MPIDSSSLRTTLLVLAVAGAGTWSYYVLQRWLHSPSSTQVAEDGETLPDRSAAKSGPRSTEDELHAKYDGIENALELKNLSLDAIRGVRKYFGGLRGGEAVKTWGSPWPKEYSQLEPPDGPLPFPTVRLLVIPLEDAPKVVSLAAAATREVVKHLPSGEMFMNQRSSYHVTLFHTSGLWEPVTNPFVAGGECAPTTPPPQRYRSSDSTLEKEIEVLTSLAAATLPPILKVDRLALADSGTLLLLLTEYGDSNVSRLRERGRQLFPGMPTNQPNIIHVSLMRTLNPTALDKQQLHAVQQVCKKWTEKMKGLVFAPSNLWFVHEKEYSTVIGRRHILPLKDIQS